MTTIAWDGKTLAADSQATAGNIISSTGMKKIKTPGEDEIWRVRGDKILAVAASGDVCATLELVDALKVGLQSNTKMRKGLAFTAMAIRGKDKGFEIFKAAGEEEIAIYELDEWRSFGSGSAFALSALKMGKTAKEAVEHAISLDLYSGGEVHTFEFTE